jgi:hypothetical protein
MPWRGLGSKITLVERFIAEARRDDVWCRIRTAGSVAHEKRREPTTARVVGCDAFVAEERQKHGVSHQSGGVRPAR